MASSDPDSVIANHDSSKGAGGGPSGSRYRFRPDLQIVRDDAGTTAPSEITIVDARSGERHVFTADEFYLCQAADGINTLPAIRQAFKLETGREISHGELFAFFRRLRRLGLLAENSLEQPLRGTRTLVAGKTPLTEAGKPTGASGSLRRAVASEGPTPSELENRGLAGSEEPEAPGDFGGGIATEEFQPMLYAKLEGHPDSRAAAQNSLAVRSLALGGREHFKTSGAFGRPKSARVILFNPNALLGIIVAVTRPLKHVFLPLLLAFPAIAWLTYQQSNILEIDLRAFDASDVGLVILALAVVSITCRFTQGALIRGFGVDVKQFGIALTFGIPRFFIDLGGIRTLGRRGQLWVHSAPLIARLSIFCACMLLWFGSRQSTPLLSHLGLITAQTGLVTFLLSALPLLRSDGYRWLVTYLGRRALHPDEPKRESSRAAGAVSSNFAVRASHATTIYAVAVTLAASALALLGLAYVEIVTTLNVRLLTAVLLIGLSVALAAWSIALWNYRRVRQIETLDPREVQQALRRLSGQIDVASQAQPSISTVGKVFWALALCVLLAVAFLPYRYRAAGTFETLPAQRTVVAVRTSGVVEQVLVREGDWVAANQVLAKLSSEEQQRDVAITSAELQRAKAQLALFGGSTTTTKDDSALEQSLADALGDEADSASRKKDASSANYARTQVERAARAEVERLTRKLAHDRDQLAQTNVRAPKEGRVMTPNVQFLTGTWLRRGSEFLSLEDTRTLEAEISIPEADIGLIKVGDKVQLRPWSDQDGEIVGTVTEIAPAAQSKQHGQMVRVRASLSNPGDSLRPAMSGYAKIDGENMRVWQAFTRRIIRVVRVEIWSWIP
jgi:RND family efflux transporter MFP subunit